MCKKIFLPDNSDALLKNGKNNNGYATLLIWISFNSSNIVIWSRKLVPKIIGQYGILLDSFNFVIKLIFWNCF